MKRINLLVLMSIVVLMAACKDEPKEVDTNTTTKTESGLNPEEELLSEEDSMMHQEEEGIAENGVNMPKINSSYFGQDNQGYEVTYNFFGEGKFEKFSFKGEQEKNIAGTYKEVNGNILLSSPEGDVTFEKQEGNIYNVVKNGKKIYTVKLIN